jgi:asparagine synthase (glutamine-hydrolysing)
MWDRIVMRRAMDNILPQKIQWRTSKAGLGMNFRKNMLQFDENTLEDLIYKNSDLIAEYVDVKHLKETLKQYMEGNKLVEPLDLWLSVILIIWIKNN